MKRKIIVCDAILDKGVELLRNAEDIELIDATKLSKDDLMPLLKDVDVAITRSSTDVDDRFLSHANKLKAVVRAGVGVDNIDIQNCSKRGVIVMNVPTANTIAAVELTMAHLLTSARSFVNAHNFLKFERKWEREKWYGIELKDKTLGIIGFGNIGSRVAVRAKAFGMNIIAYDPYIPASKITDLEMTCVKHLDEILTKSDFITIHTPKTKETNGMIGLNELAKMKDKIRLINCARGGLYTEEALCEGLKSGKIAWLGIDVFEKEPATNHPLLEFENISVTSHLGANTLESQENIAIQACENALNAARGIVFANALNLPIKTEDLPPFVEPYIELVSKMAFLAAQLDKSPIKSIKLEAEGKIGEYTNSMLTFAAVGALNSILGETINYVNAEFIAKDKGIELACETLPNSGYNNKLSVKISTDNSVVSVSGTVFNEDEQRIVALNGFKTDFKPKGKMLVFKNKDIPGVIATISSVLAENNINIADFRLGRDGFGYALAVVLVDECINQKVLDILNELDACVFVKYVEV
ncbi:MULTISPECIES: phosphoglycerate dehydrogenase [unclassified Campylobacter]|uniref:phosphoglycerate dehydrogenase n=1 Tax=unclassified Campylobacter TaxID=2593542 RepID=UPI0012380A9E|nr:MULTISPECIES: phosphoglycerate dehydrogenase [unclassified Campylobacter]KAA6224816.1 phosphoglycerate dehydrogenase [Campylobacter sp. LR185c]KAA6227391.1 phosphoglycerate dehydrogenase [Campylobacter sp. LR196d]KAA6228768.1 phosphoglycerate dehydrogenase [Campylobacter sp. LR286c]KAA6229578.1 phosphoglycerate dehydrogenase [Campylobacter sp. LR264d]KAA6230822.1 phosphoglycerate dehydrogenase [Campylobacter sp. LR291e]